MRVSRAYLQKKLQVLIIGLVALIVASLAVLFIGEHGLLAIFGRSADFTGRQELFDAWPRFFLERPIFGYGFDGFFTDRPGAPSELVADLTGRSFATFESSYLDLLIQFGLTGGFLYACVLLSALSTSIGYYKTSASKYKFVPMFVMVWSIAGSALDSGILIQNRFECVLVFWIYFGIDRAYKARPRRVARDTQQRLGCVR
jgi:exopolysaccharide production protein ExoQ